MIHKASPLYKLMILACRPPLVQGSLEHPPLVLLHLIRRPASSKRGNLFYKKKKTNRAPPPPSLRGGGPCWEGLNIGENTIIYTFTL